MAAGVSGKKKICRWSLSRKPGKKNRAPEVREHGTLFVQSGGLMMGSANLLIILIKTRGKKKRPGHATLTRCCAEKVSEAICLPLCRLTKTAFGDLIAQN